MPSAVTVFVSNFSRSHEYASAARYGALRPITSGNFPIFKTNRLREEIAKALCESTKEDFLLLSGSSVVAGLCMSMWLEQHGQVKLLLFDRAQTPQQYVTRVITRKELRAEIEQQRSPSAIHSK